jgi:hypothetical protein
VKNGCVKQKDTHFTYKTLDELIRCARDFAQKCQLLKKL